MSESMNEQEFLEATEKAVSFAQTESKRLGQPVVILMNHTVTYTAEEKAAMRTEWLECERKLEAMEANLADADQDEIDRLMTIQSELEYTLNRWPAAWEGDDFFGPENFRPERLRQIAESKEKRSELYGN